MHIEREREREGGREEGKREREGGGEDRKVDNIREKPPPHLGYLASFTLAWLFHLLSKPSVSLHWLYEFLPYLSPILASDPLSLS